MCIHISYNIWHDMIWRDMTWYAMLCYAMLSLFLSLSLYIYIYIYAYTYVNKTASGASPALTSGNWAMLRWAVTKPPAPELDSIWRAHSNTCILLCHCKVMFVFLFWHRGSGGLETLHNILFNSILVVAIRSPSIEERPPDRKSVASRDASLLCRGWGGQMRSYY